MGNLCSALLVLSLLVPLGQPSRPADPPLGSHLAAPVTVQLTAIANLLSPTAVGSAAAASPSSPPATIRPAESTPKRRERSQPVTATRSGRQETVGAET